MSNSHPRDQDPINSDEGAQIDQAFAAYLTACDRGEVESREDFLDQFPRLAGQLRELMEAADLIGNFTHASDSPASSKERSPKSRLQKTDEAALTGNDETVGIDALGPDDEQCDLSGLDPHATLPVAHRPRGDSGPSLPFEMEDYTLLKVLGMGGMGVVYLAKQRDLDRLVAVKMIRSGILAGSDEVKRFYTEAKAAARLRHPNIVAVHQFGQRAGHHFFSMQYIQGTDLQRLLKTGPLTPRRRSDCPRRRPCDRSRP